ncbi:MAG: NAD(P)H-dependent oxidoreductase [Sphingomonas sp.]
MTDAAFATMEKPPIQHALIYVNPSPDSFDHAIVEAYQAEASARGQRVVVRDLYGMGFDPLLRAVERPLHGAWSPAPDVLAELDILRSSDILVLVYPIWFGMPPAMLKGYVDRVLGAGYSFRDLHDQIGQEVLKHKPLLSFSTSGASRPWLDEQGQILSLREVFDVYLWRGFGMKQSEHVMIDCVVPHISQTYAREQLERVRQVAERTCSVLASDRHSAHTAEVMARRADRPRAASIQNGAAPRIP